MSIDVNGRPEQTVATQLSEIVADLQRLMEQEILLMRREVENDLRCRAAAASLLAAGIWILAIDIVMVGFCCAFLFHWLGAPAATDPARFPLWACFGLVAAVMAAAGAIMTQLGWARMKSCNASSQIGRL